MIKMKERSKDNTARCTEGSSDGTGSGVKVILILVFFSFVE